MNEILTVKEVAELKKPSRTQAIEELADLKNIEIKMEEAEHAFALMTTISNRIETAYQDIIAIQEK